MVGSSKPANRIGCTTARPLVVWISLFLSRCRIGRLADSVAVSGAFDARPWSFWAVSPKSASSKTPAKKRRSLGIMALEPRIMFDAAAATTAAAADSHASASAGASLAAVSAAEHAAVTPNAAPDAASTTIGASQTTSAQAITTAPSGAAPDTSHNSNSATPSTDASAIGGNAGSGTIHEIVIIDSAVPNISDLINGVKPGDQVFLLDATKDGVQQIADIIRENNLHDLSAIQIVSRGLEGEIRLGATTLTGANLADHAADLATIGGALTANGDILLFGCNVASGTAGQQFLSDLTTYTGADVAASTDLTGAARTGRQLDTRSFHRIDRSAAAVH